MTTKPGFHIAVCPDAALLRLLVDELVSSARSSVPAGVPTERHVFWGDEELPPRFFEALNQQAFMPVLRVIVIRNAHNMVADVWKKLSKSLARPNPQTLPVFCLEGPWDKGQPKVPAHIIKLPMYAFAVEKGWLVQRPGLTEATLKRHMQLLCKTLNLTAEPGAIEVIAPVLPLDATAVTGEMQKLALHAAVRAEREGGAACLHKSDAALVAHDPDFNIFNLIRQLMSGRSAEAWKSVLREQAKGEELIFPLLGLFQREARFCWQVLTRDTGRMAPRDAESRQEVASRLGVNGLVALWDAMHDAELAIKTGRLSPAQSLDALMGELAVLFAPRGPQNR